MLEEWLGRYTFIGTTLVLGIGFYGVIYKRNLLKKLIGLTLFQTAIFLFYIGRAMKQGGSVPIIDPALGSNPAAYINPLPHVLILTAIVVSVATTGVALAIVIRIYRHYGSLDERVILERMRQE